MIISEKQIMQLIAYISDFAIINYPSDDLRARANLLVDEIRNQQSEELKTIE